MGISLAGGKTDKACLAVIEYFPKFQKVFLSRVFDKIKNEENISSDLKIHEIIQQYRGEIESIALDVPWELPLCLKCQLKCPGYENCHEPHIQWMWSSFRKWKEKKKALKLFTPYTERCCEILVSRELEEPFVVSHALGANTAPLFARAKFILNRMKVTSIECNPRLSIWRIGRALQVNKSQLRQYKHSASGDESRKILLTALSEKNVAFVYDQDFKLMIQNSHAFEAFICAFTAFLKYRRLTEERPVGFPKEEAWIEFPIENIDWKKL